MFNVNCAYFKIQSRHWMNNKRKKLCANRKCIENVYKYEWNKQWTLNIQPQPHPHDDWYLFCWTQNTANAVHHGWIGLKKKVTYLEFIIINILFTYLFNVITMCRWIMVLLFGNRYCVCLIFAGCFCESRYDSNKKNQEKNIGFWYRTHSRESSEREKNSETINLSEKIIHNIS